MLTLGHLSQGPSGSLGKGEDGLPDMDDSLIRIIGKQIVYKNNTRSIMRVTCIMARLKKSSIDPLRNMELAFIKQYSQN